VIFLGLILLLLTLGSPAAYGEPEADASPPEPVNETLTRNVDVTGDGLADLISLDLRGAGWEQPITWTLTVESRGKIVLRHRSDDAWLDANFADPGFVAGCSDYLSCKQKYYEKDLLRGVVALADLAQHRPPGQSVRLETAQKAARKDLMERLGVPEERAGRISAGMARRLGNGCVAVLNIPVSAVQSHPPVMYVPEMSGFVKILEP